MKTAIQFGAGNIGRGFMGQLFFEAGYQTIFIEADRAVVEFLNTSPHYPLHLLDAATQQTFDLEIRHIQTLHIDEIEKIAEAITYAEVMGSAVGVPNLIHIAPLLVVGIRKRFRPKSTVAVVSGHIRSKVPICKGSQVCNITEFLQTLESEFSYRLWII